MGEGQLVRLYGFVIITQILFVQCPIFCASSPMICADSSWSRARINVFGSTDHSLIVRLNEHFFYGLEGS